MEQSSKVAEFSPQKVQEENKLLKMLVLCIRNATK